MLRTADVVSANNSPETTRRSTTLQVLQQHNYPNGRPGIKRTRLRLLQWTVQGPTCPKLYTGCWSRKGVCVVLRQVSFSFTSAYIQQTKAAERRDARYYTKKGLTLHQFSRAYDRLRQVYFASSNTVGLPKCRVTDLVLGF